MMEKILIIDDSLMQGGVLKAILADNYTVELCQNGEDGLQKAHQIQPGLILLDIIMPGLDGFETLTRLKKQAATKNIPVILITSLSDVGNEEKGLTLGAVDYIVKPYNAGIVRARVRTHMQLYAYQRTIENLALLDGLTGIPNRRSYDERRQLAWFRAIQRQEPISLALLDIDFFKQYNDTFGHPHGDSALIQIARAITSSLHTPDDFAARYGGEEFVLLLPDTLAQRGKAIAQEIQQDVLALRIPHPASPNGLLTVSIGGVSVVPQAHALYEDYIQLADSMLYRAKDNGRNTVIWAE